MDTFLLKTAVLFTGKVWLSEEDSKLMKHEGAGYLVKQN